MTISIVTFAGNSGSSGGGLYNSRIGSGTVTNATFNLNKASSGSGGGVYNAGKLTFTNATIAQNSALLGGGVYNSLGLAHRGQCHDRREHRLRRGPWRRPGRRRRQRRDLQHDRRFQCQGKRHARRHFPLVRRNRLAATAPTT